MRTALLQVTSITKSYAGIAALKGVSFDLQPGEVHALVGENGAGKSTLIKIVTGAEQPDSGTLTVCGQAVRRMEPATSRALGIAAIYQQPEIFPDLTVAENIAVALEPPGGWRLVRWAERRRRATELLARVGASIDPERQVGTLTMPEQQLLEIAKALGADARILIMDEPSASLSEREVGRLFEVVARLRDEGAGIVYVSHRMDEIFALADRVTVLRDGETIATRACKEIDRPELIRLMVGRALSAVARQSTAPGDVVLELRRLSCRDAGLHDISLTVRSGEILGMAGLVGSGRSELAETIFGLRQVDSGELLLGGARLRFGSPRDAVDAGIAYVPEDRRRHGVVLEMPITANTSLASLAAVSMRGLIDRRAERERAEHFVDRLRIRTASVDADVASLSGGNQQKVALARWLATAPSLLVLDEPTQGIDVAAKAEIHALIQELAGRGLAIILISSDLPEILALSDRIAVMRQGRVAGVLAHEDATQQAVLALALEDAA